MNGLRRYFEQPREVAARKWIFQVHLWAGLRLGLYVAVSGLTGCALVFRPEIEPRLVTRGAAHETAVRMEPFQAAWNNLRRAYPDHAISAFSLNQYPGTSPGDPYRVRLQAGSRTRCVYVDSSSGDILGAQHAAIEWFQDLHFNSSAVRPV